PTMAACRPIPMLCNSYARGSGDESSSRRYIESAGTIAAGSARIQDRYDFSIPERFGLLAHHARESDQLLRRFTLHSERSQECADLSIGRCSGHDFFHGRARFLLVEIDTVDHLLDKIGDHDARKFLRIFLPTAVMIDSQWN